MLSMDESFREHMQTVYRYLLSLTHDQSLAEELAQETFYQAVKGAARFDGSCKVSTWLCAIAKNLFQNERRRQARVQPLDESAVESHSPEQEVLSSAGQIELLRKLHLLDSEMREVLHLRLLGGLSFGEIGEIMGRTENWARVTYYRGKERLKKELQNDEQQA